MYYFDDRMENKHHLKHIRCRSLVCVLWLFSDVATLSGILRNVALITLMSPHVSKKSIRKWVLVPIPTPKYKFFLTFVDFPIAILKNSASAVDFTLDAALHPKPSNSLLRRILFWDMLTLCVVLTDFLWTVETPRRLRSPFSTRFVHYFMVRASEEVRVSAERETIATLWFLLTMCHICPSICVVSKRTFTNK